MVPRLSAQLVATLISLTEDEPFQVLTRGPTGPRAGIEGLRRIYQRFDPTGPRTVKTVLKRIVAVKPVPVSQLRSGIEELEKMFEEYQTRSGNPLPEDRPPVPVSRTNLGQHRGDPRRPECWSTGDLRGSTGRSLAMRRARGGARP